MADLLRSWLADCPGRAVFGATQQSKMFQRDLAAAGPHGSRKVVRTRNDNADASDFSYCDADGRVAIPPSGHVHLGIVATASVKTAQELAGILRPS